MIDLTPIDIRKKKGDFKRAVRGYDTDLVDDFLDLVAERLEELVKQNMSLSDKLARVEEQIGEYKQRDRAMTDALVSAQQVREEVRRQAEKEAELRHREAQAEASAIRAEAAAAREREEEEIRRLRARRVQVIQSFRTLLDRELTELKVVSEQLEMEARESGARDGGQKPAARAAKSQERAKPAPAPEAEAAPEPRAAQSTFELDAEETDAPAGTDEAASDAAPPAAQPKARAKQDRAGAGPADAEDEGPDWLSSIMDERS